MAQTTHQFSWQQSTVNPSNLDEVQSLRQELANTQKKLQEYADAAISLYNELRGLREAICKTCKDKLLIKTAAPSSQQFVEPASSSFPNRFSRSKTVAKPTNFWHRMLKGKQRPARSGSPDRIIPVADLPDTSVSPDPPESSLRQSGVSATVLSTTEKSDIVSKPLSKSSSRIITPEPTAPQWSARRDATANTTLNVTFVRSFIHKDRVMSVKFSADGKYLATASGSGSVSVAIFDVETGKKIGALVEYASQYSSGASHGIMCVRFSPNSRYLAIADMGARVMVWDIPNKRIRNIFRGHESEIHSVDISPNGRLVASACCDSTVRIWNMRGGSTMVFSDNAQEFFSVKFSPNGRYVAAGNYDGILRIWEVRTGRLVKTWNDHEGGTYSVTFTADGRGLLSGTLRGAVTYWDVSSLGMVQSGGEPVAIEPVKYNGHTGAVRYAVNSPDIQFVASASDDITANIWDTHSARRQYTLLGHEGPIYSVDFSPAGTYLATGSGDGRAALWKYVSTEEQIDMAS